MKDQLWYMETLAFNKMLANISVFKNNVEAFGQNEKVVADSGNLYKHENVATLSIMGPLLKTGDVWSRYFGYQDYEQITDDIKTAQSDSDIDTLVLVMDTPGGQVAGLNELSKTLRDFAAEKTLVVQVNGLLASAGYYIAAHADEIYANKMDLIGSIGVRVMLYDYSEMFAKEGIKAIPIDTGEHKSAGALGTEITESQQAEYQRIVDHYFDDFLSVIKQGRGISDKDLRTIADGRVFFATDQEAGFLIDGVQSLQETLDAHVVVSRSDQKSRNRYKSLRSSSAALIATL